MKGYVLLDIKSREIFVSRNVMFYENIFPCNFSNNSEQDQNVEFLELSSLHDDVPNNYISPKDHNMIDNDDENSNTDNDITDSSSESDRREDITENHDQINIQPEHDQENQQSTDTIQQDLISTEDQDLRRSKRSKKISGYLKNYQVNGSFNVNNYVLLECINHTYKSAYPITFVVSYKSLSKDHFNYTLAISTNKEPQSYAEASKNTEWMTAINKELNALELK